jgi:hypothetical protein
LSDTHPASGKPLIVTPTFINRVDDTPRGQRPQDSGSAKSRRGHEVHRVPEFKRPRWDGLAYIAYAT